MTRAIDKSVRVSAIVPARNEEAVIGACIESLARQEEIAEVLVVNDQSTDQTAGIVRGLMQRRAQVRLLEAGEPSAGWMGKSNAVWQGAREAQGEWLLFTDADAIHADDSARKALELARGKSAVLVSFSPEQVMETWYEKSLIPYVYCRLGRRFSYAEVNDPQRGAAAANGQFLMIRRDVYEFVGGHASVAGEVVEDVALAKRVKSAGCRIWFGGGKGIVRVRMYRSFGAMWEGWRKNLYPLMGGNGAEVGKETARAVAPVLVMLVAAIVAWGLAERLLAAGVLVVGLLVMFLVYEGELRRNEFPRGLVWYGMPGALLFAAILWASYRGYGRGKLKWKGREYPVRTSRASKG